MEIHNCSNALSFEKLVVVMKNIISISSNYFMIQLIKALEIETIKLNTNNQTFCSVHYGYVVKTHRITQIIKSMRI